MKKPKVIKFKDKNEYREMWNMLNARQNCLEREINEIFILKGWLDKRSGFNNETQQYGK